LGDENETTRTKSLDYVLYASDVARLQHGRKQKKSDEILLASGVPTLSSRAPIRSFAKKAY
jgi:hypothetical protein